MMMKNTKIKICLFSLFLFACTLKVNAAVGSINIGGTTLNVGETKTLNIGVSGDGVQAASGFISSNDSSCVEVISISSQYGTNEMFAALGTGTITTAGSVTVKGLKSCSTSLRIYNASVSTADKEEPFSSVSGTITVKEKEPDPAPAPSTPSNNDNNSNNTSTPSNNTSNNTNAPSSSSSTSNSSNTTSTDVSTSASSIVKKSGSGNNSLSSLSVTNYTLDKKFNTNTTNYSINVASDVKSINVNAKASDSKAKVTIYGTNSLKAGKNTVSVVVVAENGDKKTYTIIVNKEKGENDPEEVVEEPKLEEPVEEEKSSDKDLLGINPSIGILSPVFDKNKTKYVIYLPYEVEEISFEASLSDPNATLDVTEIEKLKVGDNKVTFKVTAQDGSEKKYVVIVKRGINPEIMDNKNSILKALKLTSGKLTKKFNKDIYEYYYKGKDIKIEAIAEDENADINIIKNDNIYYVEVTSPSGETSIYTLRPYKFYNTLGFKIGVGSGGFVAGFVTKTLIRRYALKRKNKKLSSKK